MASDENNLIDYLDHTYMTVQKVRTNKLMGRRANKYCLIFLTALQINHSDNNSNQAPWI